MAHSISVMALRLVAASAGARMPTPGAQPAAGPAMEGIDAAHRIRAAEPRVGVMILSQYADEAYAS